MEERKGKLPACQPAYKVGWLERRQGSDEDAAAICKTMRNGTQSAPTAVVSKRAERRRIARAVRRER